ncbi:MAG TPA: hypothetical protein VJ123_02215 [Anaerolineales bacterium]|nr:hypothetical protein [Anaerolineales bacterium]
MEKALETPGQPVRRGTMAHEHDVYALLADSAAAQGDLAGVQRYAPRAEELARRDDHRLYLAIAQRAQGIAQRLVGEHGEAEAQLNQALESFREMGARWQLGRTLVEMGELALARSKDGAAHGHYQQAMAAFEELQAAPDAARVRVKLESIAGKSERKGARRKGVGRGS